MNPKVGKLINPNSNADIIVNLNFLCRFRNFQHNEYFYINRNDFGETVRDDTAEENKHKTFLICIKGVYAE